MGRSYKHVCEIGREHLHHSDGLLHCSTSSSFFLFPVAKAIFLGVLDAMMSPVALIAVTERFCGDETQICSRQTTLQRSTIRDDTDVDVIMHDWRDISRVMQEFFQCKIHIFSILNTGRYLKLPNVITLQADGTCICGVHLLSHRLIRQLSAPIHACNENF